MSWRLASPPGENYPPCENRPTARDPVPTKQPRAHACRGHAVRKKTNLKQWIVQRHGTLSHPETFKTIFALLAGLVNLSLNMNACVRKNVSHLYRGCYICHPTYHRCITNIILNLFINHDDYCKIIDYKMYTGCEVLFYGTERYYSEERNLKIY